MGLRGARMWQERKTKTFCGTRQRDTAGKSPIFRMVRKMKLVEPHRHVSQMSSPLKKSCDLKFK